MDDCKTAIRIVANLGQRVRRARRQLRQLQALGRSTEEIQGGRDRENEAWNAFQASKRILNQTLSG